MNALALRRMSLFLLATAVLLGCWLVPVDRVAREDVEAGLKRALTAFAVARTLGAVISVAQGTQVDVKPAGVGVGFAPGQALQPLNELVDRFAAVMLAASAAFGIQLILLKIGAHAWMSVGVSAAVLAWLVLRWRADSARAANWLRPVLIVLLLARFALPLSAMANEALYRTFMADDYRASLTTMEQSPTAVTGRAPEAPVAGEGLLGRFELWWKGLPSMKAGYDAILQMASDWTDKIVRLLSLFILQTVVLPIGFLWVTWRLAGWAVRGTAPASAPA